MTDMHDERIQANSRQQPFVIMKNVRPCLKKPENRRKQSYQHPSSAKKVRKMTIQISHANSLPQSRTLGKSDSQKKQTSSHSRVNNENNQQEQDYQMQIKPVCQCSQVQQENNEHNQIQQIRIPFNCNEWELDKQSPYLKNYQDDDNMENQIDHMKLQDL